MRDQREKPLWLSGINAVMVNFSFMSYNLNCRIEKEKKSEQSKRMLVAKRKRYFNKGMFFEIGNNTSYL